ncbi:MAG: hypothetical protein ACO1QS_05970 [Verrucomicrobiota bacterium]
MADRIDIAARDRLDSDVDQAGTLLDRLNPYSHRVACALLARLPQLADYATPDNSPGAPEGSLLIRMDQPVKSSEPGLYVATDVEEITVGFRACYVHFMDYEHTGTDDHIDRAITYVHDLLEDRIVIKKWFRQGILCGSSLDAPTVLPPPSRSGITTVQMISWSGTNDKVVLVPAAY